MPAGAHVRRNEPDLKHERLNQMQTHSHGIGHSHARSVACKAMRRTVDAIIQFGLTPALKSQLIYRRMKLAQARKGVA